MTALTETVAGALPLTRSPSKKSGGRRPAAEDFTPGAVNKAVIAETLQHPLTLLPAVTGAVGGLYIGLLGLNPMAFAVTFASTLLAAGGWVINYFMRGETFAKRHVQELQDRRLALRQDEVDRLAEGWQSTHHAEGIKQVAELRDAYGRLRDFLEAGLAENEAHGLQLRRLLVLAEDTFREGVAILTQALAVQRALDAMDLDALRRELHQWRQAPPPQTDAASQRTRIEALEKRLALGDEQAAVVDRLLAESEVLETALQSTHLEAAQLESPEVLFAKGHTAAELERAVKAARRVEDRLKADSRVRTADDELYLAAGSGGAP